VKAVKAIMLFIIGLFLALFTFPAAFFVSAALGYLIGILAMLVGVYMIAKHERKTLPLVLGVIVILVSIPALLMTMAVHVGVYAAKEAVEAATEEKTVEGKGGEPLKLGDWEVTVTTLREEVYVKKRDTYYRAQEGYKVVLIGLIIRNTGKEAKSLSDIWRFTLITDASKSYERGYIFSLQWLPHRNVTESIQKRAMEYKELSMASSVAPSTYVEGDLLFQIPVNETPVRLYFEVGIIGGYKVIINIAPS